MVINPGNPTGAIFNSETIHKILEFSVKHNLVLIADEVFLFKLRFTEKTFIRKELLSFHLGRSWKL